MFSRTRSCTRSFVCSRWQSICWRSMRSDRNENGTGGSSPCSTERRRDSAMKSMLARSEPGRRPRLQPSPPEAERLQRLGQRLRRRLSGTARRPLFRPDVNQTVEERPGRDDQRCAGEALTVFELEAGDAPVLDEIRPALPRSSRCRLRIERCAHPLRCSAACQPGRAATRPPARGCG